MWDLKSLSLKGGLNLLTADASWGRGLLMRASTATESQCTAPKKPPKGEGGRQEDLVRIVVERHVTDLGFTCGLNSLPQPGRTFRRGLPVDQMMQSLQTMLSSFVSGQVSTSWSPGRPFIKLKTILKPCLPHRFAMVENPSSGALHRYSLSYGDKRAFYRI